MGADSPAAPDLDHAPRPVVLTRPCGQNERLADRLRARGRQVLIAPALRLRALPDALPPSLVGVDLVVFVSGNAARFFLDGLARLGRAWPTGVAAATVGPGSAAALRAHPAFGDAPALVSPPASAPRHDSEALWDCLRDMLPALRRVLVVRGTAGRDWLAARLREQGVRVDLHAAYERGPQPWSDTCRDTFADWAAAQRPAVWLATSTEGAHATAAAVRMAGLDHWWAACRFVATHPRIAAELATLVWGQGAASAMGRDPRMLQTCSADDEAVFAAIESAV